ncbi:G-patch domain-containing protein [Diaporthe sp. PMI_573]|nr:G-patch domain-containing protein [Diaporthaceae sp. PMI_573]
MNMTFDDPPAKQPETSLQRSQRLRKEGLKRGIVASKAELAAQERQRREEGLSRSLITGAAEPSDRTGAASSAANPPKTKSKGLAMMAKMGFTPGSALGSRDNPTARSEPLRIETKEDRGGIGADADKKRKLAEAAEAAGADKRARLEELGDYRVRMARERDAARKEKLVFAAQKVAEKMDEDDGGASTLAAGGEVGGKAKASSSRPLRSVPVVYRGLVRRREEAERDRRMRYDLEQSSGGLSARLPAYEDEGMDDDDKMALGGGGGSGAAGARTEKKNKTVYMPADDLDEEDAELDEFEALEVDDKLARLVACLRERHRYCFWCKLAYPDEEMEGCPGLTEEDHD